MLMSLTPREREVVVRIGSGMNSKLIARELGVSTRTVEYHRGKIRRKLGTTSQNDLSRFALDFLTAQFETATDGTAEGLRALARAPS
jgi:DNA-binding CsgD family transcriptional regulator